MPRTLIRKTPEGVVIGEPRQCYGMTAIAAVPGMRTVEEWVHVLLAEDEMIVGGFEQPRIAIKRGEVVVGYFEVTSAGVAPGAVNS
jgi:hypothetical protein